MNPLFEFLVAVSGMFLALLLWVGVQDLVRRRSGCRNPDKDVLDFLLNGCGGSCGNKGHCHSAHTDPGGAR